MNPYFPTGTPISGKNQLQVIQIQGRTGGRTLEQVAHAARNRRNYLSRTRTAGGRWAK